MHRMLATALLLARMRTPGLAARALLGVVLRSIGLPSVAARVFRAADGWTRRRRPARADDLADWWAFLANESDARAGRSHHAEPLLDVSVRPERAARAADARGRARLVARIAPTGLRLLVLTAGAEASDVVMLLDGRPLARLPVRRRIRLLPTLSVGMALVTLHRDVLERFPVEARLVAGPPGPAADGTARRFGGRGLRIAVPEGDGSILDRSLPLIREVGTQPLVDKKGSLVALPEEHAVRSAAFIELHRDAATFLRDELGKDLFLIYGTLLGPVREGRFLPWDDDFDVAYLSDHTDVDAVRAESIDVMRSLAAAGFAVGLNPEGRPFRLGRHGHLGSTWLDVRPAWFEDGHLLAPNHARVPMLLDDLVPLATLHVDGDAFRVPRRPDAFLAAYYGDDWREPKPGHRGPSRLTAAHRDVFARLRIPHPEVVAVNRAAEAAGLGPVVRSTATVPLYPLEARRRLLGV